MYKTLQTVLHFHSWFQVHPFPLFFPCLCCLNPLLHWLNGLLFTPQIVKCLVNFSHFKSRNNVQHKKLQMKIGTYWVCSICFPRSHHLCSPVIIKTICFNSSTSICRHFIVQHPYTQNINQLHDRICTPGLCKVYTAVTARTCQITHRLYLPFPRRQNNFFVSFMFTIYTGLSSQRLFLCSITHFILDY